MTSTEANAVRGAIEQAYPPSPRQGRAKELAARNRAFAELNWLLTERDTLRYEAGHALELLASYCASEVQFANGYVDADVTTARDVLAAVLAAGTGDGEQSSSEAPETVARSGGEPR